MPDGDRAPGRTSRCRGNTTDRKQSTLTTIGPYNEPAGAYLP
jgi:hypothetical protein